LNELDNYISRTFRELGLSRGKVSRSYSQEERKARYQVEKYSKLYKSDKSKENLAMLKEAKINLRNTPKGAIKGEKAYYCRYADD
jgi:hypothetical protein